jgi:transcriptional regulator with XRE-family HTH domain
MSIEMDMVKRLKAHMRHLRLTQSDMSRDLRMSRQIVSKWMTSGHIPENRQEDIVDWLRGYNLNITLPELKYGPEAKEGTTYLKMVLAALLEAENQAGTQLEAEVFVDTVSMCVEQRFPIHVAKKIIADKINLAKASKGRRKRAA